MTTTYRAIIPSVTAWVWLTFVILRRRMVESRSWSYGVGAMAGDGPADV